MNQYIQLRNNIYHFRLKVPKSLRCIIDKAEITRTLKTDSYQLACIKVSTKSALIYQLKNSDVSKNELSALLVRLFDFSEQKETFDSEVDMKIGDQFQKSLDIFTRISPNSHIIEASSLIPGQNGALSCVEPPYLLSKAWSDFADFKTWNDKRAKEYTAHYHFLLALWGDVDVRVINKQDIRKCLNTFELMPQGNKKPYNKLSVAERLNYPTDAIPEENFISPKTVKSLLKTLQGFFSTFLTGEKDCFIHSPTANVRYTISEKRFGIYTDLEIQAFEHEADAVKEPWQRWALLLAIYTGARRGEIVKFMYDGVKLDSEHKLYYFELLEGKTDAAKRKVPVHPKLIEKGVLKISGIVIKADAITDYINKTRDALEIPLNDLEDSKRIYHSFRHSFITKGISKGVTVEHLQSLVGHSKNLGITSRYVHRLSLLDLYEVMMKISYH